MSVLFYSYCKVSDAIVCDPDVYVVVISVTASHRRAGATGLCEVVSYYSYLSFLE